MTEDDYDQLSYPENLDTLANRTIVSGASDDTALKSTPYVSQMKNFTPSRRFLLQGNFQKEHHSGEKAARNADSFHYFADFL